MKNKRRWGVVVIYAMAMAWVESAVVFYLRTMIDRIDPYQPNPLPAIFDWPKFCLALLLMAVPVIQLGQRLCSRQPEALADTETAQCLRRAL